MRTHSLPAALAAVAALLLTESSFAAAPQHARPIFTTIPNNAPWHDATKIRPGSQLVQWNGSFVDHTGATITYTMEGDWVVLKSEEVDSMGKAATYDNRYKFDGKEYPFKNALIEGAISLKRTDDLHAEGYLKGAKGKTNLKAVISKHGKTRTLTTTGVNAEGKPIHNVAVYEKQ